MILLGKEKKILLTHGYFSGTSKIISAKVLLHWTSHIPPLCDSLFCYKYDWLLSNAGLKYAGPLIHPKWFKPVLFKDQLLF